MKLNKIITTLFLLIIVTISAQSQVTDKKAIEILDKLSAKTKTYKSIKIDFTFKMENQKEKISESKNGIIILKGDKYNLNISGQKVFCDGKTSWTYIKDADEVHINNVSNNDNSISLNTLLSDYNKNFRSKLIRKEMQKGKEVYIIDLMPLQGKTYHRVRLTILTEKLQVLSAVVYDKNGTNYSYIVNSFITDEPVADDNFTFKKSDYPKAEIIDMRE